jgi:hypothetical protein
LLNSLSLIILVWIEDLKVVSKKADLPKVVILKDLDSEPTTEADRAEADLSCIQELLRERVQPPLPLMQEEIETVPQVGKDRKEQMTRSERE